MESNSQVVQDSFKDKIRFLDEGGEVKVFIQTLRLEISPYEEKDFCKSIELYTDPEITKYFDFGGPKSIDEIKKTINHYKDCSERGLLGLFSIFRREDLEFIGHFDLAPADEPGMIEIGYIIHKKYQGQGFGCESARAIVKSYIPEIVNRGYKIRGQQIRGIMGTSHPNNRSSIRLLEKMGMHFEKSFERFGGPRVQYVSMLDCKNSILDFHVRN